MDRRALRITRVFKFEENSDFGRWLEDHSNSKMVHKGIQTRKMALKTIQDSEKSGWAQKRYGSWRGGSKRFKQKRKVEEKKRQSGTDIGSYGGYLVRARVRITITNWKDVSPTLKKNLWISLKFLESPKEASIHVLVDSSKEACTGEVGLVAEGQV
ncbi:hypothetical protein IFM89_033548 [Coptis chinensis]|uniref:Uncharacterized protein n=1 Tax=Coptis chinensis TaxID=261450 RepID=A0A835LGE5_9MAGN|nr:hypothetical protein IFM89_033548 [Coptis chinensis]